MSMLRTSPLVIKAQAPRCVLQEQVSTSTVLNAMLEQLSHIRQPGSVTSSSRHNAGSVTGSGCVAGDSSGRQIEGADKRAASNCVVYEGDFTSAAQAGILTGCLSETAHCCKLLLPDSCDLSEIWRSLKTVECVMHTVYHCDQVLCQRGIMQGSHP